ncbi:hypothetical protein [Shewanella sp.]|nr:hypothetical protein [Shewanella sp.]NRB25005.1 hypothetical protein [Shewanella sp.]
MTRYVKETVALSITRILADDGDGDATDNEVANAVEILEKLKDWTEENTL